MQKSFDFGSECWKRLKIEPLVCDGSGDRYDFEKNVRGITYKKVLDTILSFAFGKRQNKITEVFNGVIERSKYEKFKVLLTALKSSDADQ